MKHACKRLLALLLCMVCLAGPVSAAASAQETPAATLGDRFWDWFSLLDLKFNVEEGYAYMPVEPFQKVFGFNKVYEGLTFLGGIFADTVRFKFAYGGKDWLVQLWKGAYFYGLTTGGEVCIYNKPADRKIEHYDAPDKADYVGMGFSIYHGGEKRFERPVETRWWQTGYAFRILSSILRRPRRNCTMDATLRFNDAGMAQAFAQALEEKGFAPAAPGQAVYFETPELYTIDGAEVHLIWRMVTESFY